jgi:hypothetical protein
MMVLLMFDDANAKCRRMLRKIAREDARYGVEVRS